MSAELMPIYLKLPVEHIVSLKFIIESYEGLAIIRTLDPARGEVAVLALSDTIQEVREILEAISEQLEIRELPLPDVTLDGDWLLAES